jgi:signal transduction histidine kinase
MTTAGVIKRLLLVEDDAGFARLLREMFKDQGSPATAVTHVESMAEAEAELGAATFDIILLDPGLPDAHGIESVRRAHAAAPRVPVVVLTGRDDETLALLALQEGAQDYLIKGQIDSRGLLRFLRYAVERNEMEATLRAVRAELERSNRELEDFATIASHDLQEPLRKIQAFGDRLSERSSAALDEESLDYLARMTSAAGRMQTLINDLLHYSQVTLNPEPPRPVDLGQVVAEVLTDLDERIRTTHGTVRVGPLPTVMGNPLQMRQLFQNLIANALKFHAAGVAPQVHIDALARGGVRPTRLDPQRQPRWEIKVRDNGIGFDQRHAEKIFAPFQRLHGRQAFEGTGMGLAICRRIAAVHGGSITAQAGARGGSTFVVVLPRGSVIVDEMAPAA